MDELANRFMYHPPKSPGIAEDHELIRDRCYWLALLIEQYVPEGRERALAITKVEECMMWANAGIARNR